MLDKSTSGNLLDIIPILDFTNLRYSCLSRCSGSKSIVISLFKEIPRSFKVDFGTMKPHEFPMGRTLTFIRVMIEVEVRTILVWRYNIGEGWSMRYA